MPETLPEGLAPDRSCMPEAGSRPMVADGAHRPATGAWPACVTGLQHRPRPARRRPRARFGARPRLTSGARLSCACNGPVPGARGWLRRCRRRRSPGSRGRSHLETRHGQPDPRRAGEQDRQSQTQHPDRPRSHPSSRRSRASWCRTTRTAAAAGWASSRSWPSLPCPGRDLVVRLRPGLRWGDHHADRRHRAPPAEPAAPAASVPPASSL